MIFVTVGTQLPFDRLLDAMDRVAAECDQPVIAQAGTGAVAVRWPNMDIRARLAPDTFEALFRAADVVVGHAGIGTVLSAQAHQRPLIICPRRFELGEHRNDHQLATARHLDGRPGIYVAWQTEEIAPFLKRTLHPARLETVIPERDRLISYLAEAIRGADQKKPQR